MDDTEVRALWDAHYPELTGWVAALVGDVDLAHDIVAESFARLIARLRTVREPRPFLFTVAANLARDHWRQADRDRRLTARLAAPTAQAATDPWLRDLVERLPERLRVPVLLHYYADLPVAEVARALRRPEGTVKRCLAEGRAALLSALETEA